MPTFSRATSDMLTGFLIPPSSSPTAMGEVHPARRGPSAGARTTHAARSAQVPSPRSDGKVTMAVPLAGQRREVEDVELEAVRVAVDVHRETTHDESAPGRRQVGTR